jgi:3-oxoacyl-[acyl-carrier protein] reductase
MSQLTGKVAIVTDASKGIGAGIAQGLGAAGAAVVVNYASSKEGAEHVVAEIISKGGQVIAVQGDVSKATDVNAINPGGVETEGVHRAGIIGSDFEKQIVAQTPLGRLGQPEDIAPIAVFLASEDSGWLTGETLIASGGFR